MREVRVGQLWRFEELLFIVVNVLSGRHGDQLAEGWFFGYYRPIGATHSWYHDGFNIATNPNPELGLLSDV